MARCSLVQASGPAWVVVSYAEGLEDALNGIPLRRIRPIPGCRALGSGPRLAKLALDIALLASLVRVVRAVRNEIIHPAKYEAADG
jgi:hypothetical protein